MVQAIRSEFGLSDVAYWQRIHRILNDPEPELAGEFGPLLNRLRRKLDTREQVRQRRRTA